MIQDIFTVYDNKSKTFCTPFFAENISTAIRSFRYAANHNDTDIGRYPEDFSLYQLGNFDNSNGSIELLKEPFLIAQAFGLIEVK